MATAAIDVPATDTIADRRVHPATVPLRFLKDAPSTLLGLPAAYAFMSRGSVATVLGFAGLVAVVIFVVYFVAWRRFRYGVGAHDLVIESGLLTRTRRSIPFDRIQDVDIERGPLQRLFGLAKVRIETGGAAKDEGLIDSVTLAEADRLRDAVRAGRVRDSTTAAPTAAQAPSSEVRTVFAMSLPRVLTAGLFNFSLLYLAGLFGLLQTFKRLLPFDVDDPASWIGLGDGRLAERFGIGAALALLFVALVVGVLFGVVRTLLSDYGLRLTAEGKRFRRTRGLLTRSDVVLPKERVQLALVKSGPLRGAWGWAALHFQTLAGATASGDRQAVAPLAVEPEIAAILAEQGSLRLPGALDLQAVSSRHLVRTLFSKALLPLLVILGVASQWRPALLALVALPLFVAVALLERRFHRYALTDDLLFIRRGVLRRALWIVPVARAQTLDLSRSLLQRALGLATLSIDTAGAPGLGGPRIVDIRLDKARGMQAALAEKLVSYSGRKSGTDR